MDVGVHQKRHFGIQGASNDFVRNDWKGNFCAVHAGPTVEELIGNDLLANRICLSRKGHYR